ncbi:MAG: 3-oxoacyl-ACP reductase FabG [Elusimicrobia bacterium]|nr:3-oxoacyl-ACP reductase FabG [Elusimicrobiota bacterium]
MNTPVVLVTGGSRGIGRSLALAFAMKGYRVGINFVHSEDQAQKARDEISSLGGSAILLKADVSDSSQVKEMVERVLSEWGRIDVLINNAGITRDRTILKMSDPEWLETIAVNLTGAFWCLRECARVMAKQQDGTILNMASIVGVKGSFGNANYAASKAGLIGLTKGAAKELGRFNIRVNALLPGFHPTDMGKTVREEDLERVRSEHALGRLTDLEEFTNFVVELSQKKSVSGQVFSFDSRVL